ncbi:MAG TPA: hypothetical protein VEY11_16175 [Pyrinomonadaceae bacterium]|nr:hypothetical protein [Pyrinomonadaceae bacterium]
MSRNIRIIKRSERTATSKPAESRASENGSTRQATRDITGHVTTWIKELQQRHTPDPRRAFANLFVDAVATTAD